MRRRRVLVALLALVVATGAGCARLPALSERLPVDPRLVSGQLPNGFTYIVRRHPTPERRVGLWLHVASGSLNETDETRGLAHFLEHMAFNGSANFPPESLVPFFESLGLTFGRDQNAFTSFNQTTYQIVVPAGNPAALDKSLLFMSDVAGRLSLLPEEIDKEREIILAELRSRTSADQRVGDYVLERLAPGSTFGRRFPIGTEATIRSLTPEDLRDYYRRWYVPSNLTLIVAGDCEPEDVVAAIRRHFDAGPATPRPAARPVGVTAGTGVRSIVATDPALTRASVSILKVEPARPPSLTVADRRRDLVERIATWIVNRRLDADVAAGRAPFQGGWAAIRQWPGAMRTIGVYARGRPDAWPSMLTGLGAALQEARVNQVSEGELQTARVAFLSEATDAARRAPTLPLRSVLREINDAVTRREPVLSAAHRVALLERLLPGITAGEVSAVFAATFDTRDVVVVAELPAAARPPGEAELVALGRAALDVAATTRLDRASPAKLLPEPPMGGIVVESRTDAPSGVTSFWLDNGVRGHHRFMAQERGKVILTITLAGGAIEEQAANRGMTEAASQAWVRPATSRLSSTAIRDLLTGSSVRVEAHVGEDAVTLTVRAAPADLEVAFQLSYLLLTDAAIEPPALERWKDGYAESIAARRLEPMQALRAVTPDVLFPAADARPRLLGLAEVRGVALEAAQAWLHRLVAAAPIEVAVVGEVEQTTALDLMSRYLGALPARARISDKTLAEARTLQRLPGPITVARTIETRTPQAAVLAGFFGADARDLRDARLLSVASRVLSTRMRRSLREERQLVYSIGVASRPGLAYPGLGLFFAQAPTDPARATALVEAVDEMFARFAEDGPTESEMAVARRQIAHVIDQEMERPEFWANRLAALDYRSVRLDDLLAARGEYERFTADEVRDAVRRYRSPDARFTIVVTPAPGT